MSYTKMVKQWEREHKQRMKQEQKELREQQEKELQFKAKLIHLSFIEEEKENQRREKETNRKANFLYNIVHQLQYKEYLTIRDMIFNDYYQVKSDLKRNKINLDIISKLVNILKQNNFISDIEENILYNTIQ